MNRTLFDRVWAGPTGRLLTGLGLVGGLALLGIPGCGGSRPKPGLVMSGAFFKEGFAPLPGRFFIARDQGGDKGWGLEVLEAADGSNVIHKGMYFKPAVGDPGFLTISGSQSPTPAYVKFWRKNGNGWDAETIYEGQYEGKFSRCRDVEVADVDGDGVDEIIVVTHPKGVVVVIDQEDGKFVPHEIAGFRGTDEEVWIHEVETGDIDADGTIEFFTTPSAPNTLDGRVQPGQINMYRYDGAKYVESLVERFETRHVKEILCYDLDGTGQPLLFAALEGESIGGESKGGETSQIRVYRWKGGKLEGEKVVDLPGDLCRFMSGADTDGDGTKEIIASTAHDGIYSIFRKGDSWQKRSIAPGSITSGFEHASVPMDTDGDGKDEVFAVSDDDKTLRRFYWDADSGRYLAEKLLTFDDLGSMFMFNIEPLPAGM